jgi:hypothetical protein
MVTILKIKNNSDFDVNFKINDEFEDANGFSIFDRMLVKDSDCGEFEYLYLFINQVELNSFMNILLDNDSTIFHKYDFTDDLINIIINNKLDEFKSKFEIDFDFDELLNLFYNESITKDIVLDKICFSGKDSLNESDYNILKQ